MIGFLKFRLAYAALLMVVFAFQATTPAFANQELFEKAKQEVDTDHVSQSTFNNIQSFVEANPNDSKGRLYLGLLLERSGLKEQAYEQLKLAVQYGPNNPDDLVTLCKEQIKLGHVESAMALADSGLKKFPNNPEILFIIGDYLIKLKRPVEAKRVLEQAYKLDPTIFGLPTSLAQLYLSRDYTRAVNYASIDLEKRPTYFRGLRVRGVAYTKLRKYSKAVTDLEPVFKTDPTISLIAQSLSLSYWWLGDYEKALKPAVFLLAFSSQPDIDNKYPVNWMVRVLRELPKEDAQKLIELYSKQISKKYNIPAYYYFLGNVFDKLNWRDLAIESYRKTIEKAHNLRPWDNEINLAYLRLQERLHNKNRDLSLTIKKWLSTLGNHEKQN